jgi:hypothetical protein
MKIEVELLFANNAGLTEISELANHRKRRPGSALTNTIRGRNPGARSTMNRIIDGRGHATQISPELAETSQGRRGKSRSTLRWCL